MVAFKKFDLPHRHLQYLALKNSTIFEIRIACPYLKSSGNPFAYVLQSFV